MLFAVILVEIANNTPVEAKLKDFESTGNSKHANFILGGGGSGTAEVKHYCCGVTLVMYVLMSVCACVSVLHALGFSLLCQVV